MLTRMLPPDLLSAQVNKTVQGGTKTAAQIAGTLCMPYPNQYVGACQSNGKMKCFKAARPVKHRRNKDCGE